MVPRCQSILPALHESHPLPTPALNHPHSFHFLCLYSKDTPLNILVRHQLNLGNFMAFICILLPLEAVARMSLDVYLQQYFRVSLPVSECQETCHSVRKWMCIMEYIFFLVAGITARKASAAHTGALARSSGAAEACRRSFVPSFVGGPCGRVGLPAKFTLAS